MRFLTDIRGLLEALASHADLDVLPAELAMTIDSLDDDTLVALLEDAAALANRVEKLRVVGAGVVARRSGRKLGQGGLAAKKGHRSPVELIQAISGGTRTEADRQVRVGLTLVPDEPPEPGVLDGPDNNSDPVPNTPGWDAELRAALLDGRMSAAQHDAIRRGLGQPPVVDGQDVPSADAVQVWATAAAQLLAEGARFPVEELHRRARQVRDALDQVGAEERFAKRYEQRSFRTWRDADGMLHARVVFDDEAGAWIDAIQDAALRPRRGGPRFVDATEQAAAETLARDRRSNEQLTYDLMMSVLHAGALAEAKDVFGAKQPGVRVVTVKDPTGPRDAFGRLLRGVGHLEDRGDPLPATVVDRMLCESGIVEVTVDACGNPLDVGREQRLYTPRQRIALAVRDGGCVFPGCTVPASYCEAHHCDHWWEHLGKTDIDRGLLLCRFHHLLLHNQGWRITREAHGPFLLHAPPGHAPNAPIELTSRSPVKWAWDPPPARPHWRAA